MRIGIDCRLSGNAHAGIGRYIENLIERLPKLAPEVTWVFFFYDQSQIPIFDKNLTNIEIIFAPIRHYSLAEQLQLPRYFNEAKLDLLHVPHFNVPLLYQGKLAITIHDLLWHEYKGVLVTTLNPLVYWLKYCAYRLITTQAVKKAKAIFVPTETVKKTLLRYYPASHSKITVTKEGVSGEFATAKTVPTTDISSQQLVYVGSLYPHKNVSVVLRALTQLPGWKLHLVGSRNAFEKRIRAEVKKLDLTSQVVFDGYLADEELVSLLHTSTALIQPSLSEGFGLTGIEAMRAKVLVIASDIPVFREIYQDGALFFDPQRPESLVDLLNSLTQKKVIELIDRGHHVSAQYSWDRMCQLTLTTYQRQLHD